MAPLPENSTDRVFLDYTSMDISHTLELRITPAGGATPIDYANTYSAWMVQRMLTTDSVQGARFQAAGSNFSLPLPFTPAIGVIAADIGNRWIEDPESAFLSLIGRGRTTGRRVRWTLFTPARTTLWPEDNRYNPGDAAPIDTFRQNFASLADAAGIAPLLTVGGDLVNVYGYVNAGKNSYWQREQRGS